MNLNTLTKEQMINLWCATKDELCDTAEHISGFYASDERAPSYSDDYRVCFEEAAEGKRDLDALRAMLPAGDWENTLQMLQGQGYIAPIETAGMGISERAPAAASEEMPISGSTAFRELPPTPVTQDLELARNFMMNTLKSFTGPYAALSLLEKVDAAQSHAEMRAQFDQWMETIIETRDGKRRADELRCALLKII